MLYTDFFYDTTVTIKFPLPAHPEAEAEYESEDFDIRIHCEGHLGTPESGRFGNPENYDHGCDPEVILKRVEIRTVPDKDVFRPARAPLYLGDMDSDRDIIGAAENIVEDMPDGLLDALRDAVGEECEE
jgi:hypothetical protein